MLRRASIIFTVVGISLIASGDSLIHSQFYQRTHFPIIRFNGDPVDTSVFLDPLPIMPKMLVKKSKLGKSEITLTLGQMAHQFYKELPVSQVWGYNGLSPGPVVEVESGETLTINWKNNLPSTHLLPPDDSLMPGMPSDPRLPIVRAVTHLHGAAVPELNLSDRFHNNDGWPDNWTVPGETQIATYPNIQSARTLWYHDHAMGTTSRNVNAGLAGMYLIRDAYERSLKLPSGNYEIPLMFQTHDFNDDGSLTFPHKITFEVYGSAISANGKVWPYLNVEPRKYRFRMLNASNARSLDFKFVDVKDSSPGPAMIQIGSDSGFLENPVLLNDPKNPKAPSLLITPAERADIIVDFSKYAGRTFLLQNNSVGEDGDAQIYYPDVMIMKVGAKALSPDLAQIPKHMTPIVKTKPETASETRRIVLGEVDTPGAVPVLMLNEKIWTDPIEERVPLNSTEVWEIANTLIDGHPFHIHLVQFQVLDRRAFDVKHFIDTKEIVYTGDPIVPPLNEQGWKDTVFSPRGFITRIIAKFGPYAGKFVYHCHILEHEDMGMMRPFEIFAP